MRESYWLRGTIKFVTNRRMKAMTQKNWLTDSSGAKWTASSGGSSSSYLEKTTQDSSKYSWDWTQTDSNYTKTDVGYSGYGSYDHTKDTWESGYSGSSSSDGSQALTMSSGGSQAHEWKYTGESSEAWTETWTNGSTSGGLKMGQVIGETDARAERSTHGTISFQNVMSTIYKSLGIDPDFKLPDHNGRPQYLLDDCQPIHGLT